MKKSEMAAFLRPHPHAEAILRKIDDAGTPWDPEDPPKPELPARLYVRAPGWVKSCDQWSVVNETAPQGDAPFEPEEVLAEMVRRYNLLPVIRQRIVEHMARGGVTGCADFCNQLRRWIDGTEQPLESQDER